MFKRFRSLVAGAALALSALPALALDLPGPLVDTDWLAKNLDAPGLVILDVRTNVRDFARKPGKDEDAVVGHIAGSRLWPYAMVRQDRVIDGVKLKGMVPEKARFESIMSDLGLAADSAVVVVSSFEDGGSATIGTRAYWTLKYFGHDKVALLDGGIEKWFMEKRPLAYEAKTFARSQYQARAERADIAAGVKEVEAASRAGRKGATQLVDGRTADFYVGQSGAGTVKGRGHIPGATMLANVDILAEDRYGFKSAADLKKLAADMGVDLNKPAITYCNTGHLASGSWFVLSEVLGVKGVKLFDGSMHEWTQDAARPITRRWEVD